MNTIVFERCLPTVAGAALALALTLGIAAPAAAAPITYTLSGFGLWQVRGSQSLGTVTVTLQGDTGNVSFSDGFSYNNGPASFNYTPAFPNSFNTVQTGSIDNVTFAVNGNPPPLNAANLFVAFTYTPAPTALRYFQTLDPSFIGYDLTQARPTFTDATSPFTSGGDFALSDGSFFIPLRLDSLSYSAVLGAVPEPSAAWLLLAGLGFVGAATWRGR